MDDIRGTSGWDEDGLGAVATLYRTLLEASDIGLGERIDADAAWESAHPVGWWDRLRLRVNTAPRYLRLALPAVGVALTLGVAGFLVTDAGSPPRTANPPSAPATTAIPNGGPTKAVAAPTLTSAELVPIARPALTAALKPYWTKAITVSPLDTRPVAGTELPAVTTAIGNTVPTQPAAPQNWELQVTITQYAEPQSPVTQLYLEPNSPKPTTGTFADGTTWAVSPASLTAIAVRTDGAVIELQVAPQELPSGRMSTDNLIHSNYLGVLQSIDNSLPTLAKLPAPAPLTWRTGSDNAAVTALATAAQTAADPAATATVLYIRSEEKSSSVVDTRERWITTDGALSYRYDAGSYDGKPAGGGTSGESSEWSLAGDKLLWSDVRAFPDTADALQQRLDQLYAEQPHTPSALFDDLASFLIESPASPRQQAAVAAVLSRIPGVVVDPAATITTGEQGVGLSLDDTRVIFDPATGRLAEKDNLTPTGAVSDSVTYAAPVRATAVRVLPDGTLAPAK